MTGIGSRDSAFPLLRAVTMDTGPVFGRFAVICDPQRSSGAARERGGEPCFRQAAGAGPVRQRSSRLTVARRDKQTLRTRFRSRYSADISAVYLPLPA